MSQAPEQCLYCRDSCGVDENGHPCGFCDESKPLDTQKDWDNSGAKWPGRFSHE